MGRSHGPARLIGTEIGLSMRRWETWVFLGTYVLVVVLVLVPTGPAGESGPREWSELWARGALYAGQVGALVSSALVTVLLGPEFAWRTIRQRVAEGWQRLPLFVLKSALTLWLAVLFVAGTAATVTAFGLLAGAHGGPLPDGVPGELLRLFTVFLLMNLLAFAVTLTLRSGAAALGLWAFYAAWLEGVIGQALPAGGVGSAVRSLLPVGALTSFLNPRAAPRWLAAVDPGPTLVSACLITAVAVGVAAWTFHRRDL